MRVKALLPSVREVEVNLPRHVTVNEAKGKICDALMIEPNLTNLIVDGRILDAKQKLEPSQLATRRITVDYLWGRQLILWRRRTQNVLRNSRILIAGAGAIGNELAKNLAMLGVREMVIVDNDLVELSNVGRMVFFHRGHLGKPKAKVLARELERRFYGIAAVPVVKRVEDVPLRQMLNVDAFASCLDNIVSRLYLTQISRKHLVPMVDGGVNGVHARIQVFIPPDWPCPACTWPDLTYSQLAGIRNPCSGEGDEVKFGSIPTTISLVSSIMAHETVKVAVGFRSFARTRRWNRDLGEPMRGVLIVDLKFNRFSWSELQRKPNCYVCGRDGVARNIVPMVEIPFSNGRLSTDSLKRRVQRRLQINNITQVRFLAEGDYGTTKIGQDCPLSDLGLRKGDLIHVLGSDLEKHEAIVKLI